MEEKTYYENVNLTCVENGYTLNYSEVHTSEKQEYPRYEYKTEVYTEDNIQEALKRMRELHGKKMIPHPDAKSSK